MNTCHPTLRAITPGGDCPICDHVKVSRATFSEVASELLRDRERAERTLEESRTHQHAHAFGRGLEEQGIRAPIVPTVLEVHGAVQGHGHTPSVSEVISIITAHLPNEPRPSRVSTGNPTGSNPEVHYEEVALAHSTFASHEPATSEGAYHGLGTGSHEATREEPELLSGEDDLTHEDIIADRCRRSLSYFVRVAWTVIMPGIPLLWNWHLEEMCRHVQGMLEEWIKKQRDPSYTMRAQNLAINCPPRSLKSTIVSICAPAWMWLQWPSWKGLFLSANPRVATRDAYGCQALITSAWYSELRAVLASHHEEGSEERARYEWTIVRDGVEEFTNSAGGVRMAMGFTAVVVGLGGDAIFIDDPNDTKKVMAEAERAKINDTWDLSLCNRVNSYTDSIRILIMQRCHEMDLTGHWHETMPDELTVYLAMPLEYDPEMAEEAAAQSPFGYRDPRSVLGDIIHPARFTEIVIAAERKRLGPYGFAGQMNQKPVPLEGGAFKRKWWRFCYLTSPAPDYHPLTGTILQDRWHLKVDGERFFAKTSTGAIARPQGCDLETPAVPIPFLDTLLISVDATFGSIDEDASRVGLLVIGIKGADRFVLEDRTIQRTFLETCDAIKKLVKDFPSVTTKLIEKKANGAAVIERLKSEVGGCVPIENNENWIVRANAMLPAVAGGNWYLLDGAPWLTAYVSEFAMFPNGAHDDRIDASSQVENHYANGGYSLPDW